MNGTLMKLLLLMRYAFGMIQYRANAYIVI